MIPSKWGQGQLFAFSALDSDAFFTDDFTGTLSGDKIGIIFHSLCRRTLYFGDMINLKEPELKCVTSDMITVETHEGTFAMLFAERHLVVGKYCESTGVFVSFGGECETVRKGDTEIHNSNDGEYTAILKREGRFAFAYGKSEDEVERLCERGINFDIEALEAQKTEPYKKVVSENGRYAGLYSKCISVMRGQLYSSEGVIKRIWSTPDRLPHRNMWLWDSVFHAIGHRHLDANVAQELILALFDVQRDDGFIPHMASPECISDITQPPVIGWGAWLIYKKAEIKNSSKLFCKTIKNFFFGVKTTEEKRRRSFIPGTLTVSSITDVTNREWITHQDLIQKVTFMPLTFPAIWQMKRDL